MKAVLVICLFAVIVHGLNVPEPKTVDPRDEYISWVVYMAKNAFQKLQFPQTKAALETGRRLIDNFFSELVHYVGTNAHEVNTKRNPIYAAKFNCYSKMIEEITEECLNIFENPYVVEHVYKLYNLCYYDKSKDEADSQALTKQVVKHLVCSDALKNLSGVV